MFSLPLLEGGQDQDQGHCHILVPPTDASSFTCNILFSNPQDQGAKDRDHDYQHHHQEHEPSDHDQAPFPPSNISEDHNSSENSSSDRHAREGDLHGSAQWMSSKMRLMSSDRIIVQKTRTRHARDDDQPPPIHDHRTTTTNNNNNIPPLAIIRVCSDCNTTKTPLWRSGPRGPKSLCNACGIRQRKARRAMAAAAANGGTIPAADHDTPFKVRKGKRSSSDVDRSVPFKMRRKIATATETTHQKKLCFDEVMISWSKDSAFHFPQDETEAAILLMALSCGLIRG